MPKVRTTASAMAVPGWAKGSFISVSRIMWQSLWLVVIKQDQN
jgi:hypothetical protein